jgi:hypothetical protein
MNLFEAFCEELNENWETMIVLLWFTGLLGVAAKSQRLTKRCPGIVATIAIVSISISFLTNQSNARRRRQILKKG